MRKLFLFFVLALIAFPGFAQEKGFSLYAEGKYFSIYGYKAMDIGSLLEKLDYLYYGNIDAIGKKETLSPKSYLAQAADSLYLEVSDILDIHMYSFHGKLVIVPDKNSINSIFKSYFRKNFSERSFFLPEKNTIYISFPDLNTGMLGHEMAHAIISRYFVVPPPARIQEVLSGYVDYKLQKKSRR